ncbi:MAG: MFS transporter [Alphaproteobacteria bacterium]
MFNNQFLQTRIGVFNALIYLPYGVLLPFLALWFAHYGWSWGQISIILGVSLSLSLFLDPIVGAIADRTQAFRALTFCLSTLSLIFWLLLPVFKDSFIWVLICYTLFRLFWVAVIPIIDNLGLAIAKDVKGNWGIIRSVGSIAFIIAAQLTGFLITGREDWVELMSKLVSLFMVLMVLGTFILPRYQTSTQPQDSFSRLKLFAQPSIAFFTIGIFLISKSSGQELFFGSIRWDAVGFSPSRISDLWTMRVGAEVISLIAFGYILRTQDSLRVFRNLAITFAIAVAAYFLLIKVNASIANILFTLTYGSALVGITALLLYLFRKETKATDLIIIGAIASVVRWLILGTTSQEQIIFIAESLHALTYGAFMIAGFVWFREILPESLSNTAMGLYNGASMLGYSIGAYSAGFMWGHLAEKSWYIEAAFAAVGLVFLLIGFARYNKDKAVFSNDVFAAK